MFFLLRFALCILCFSFSLCAFSFALREVSLDKRLEAIFEGQVQGVGFRFTADQLARKFKLTGFVENLPNGDVKLVAEGEEEELSAFLLAIRNSHLRSGIRDFEISWKPSTGEFKDFFVRYGGA